MQQIGNNPPPATEANHVPQNTNAVQQVQSPIKFDLPAFEGDGAESWLTFGFETELTAAEGQGLSVGADVF